MVAEKRLPLLDALIQAVSAEKLGEDDRIYFKYFKASISKRLGQQIEAREQFHLILDQLSGVSHETTFGRTLRIKVLIKLSKIYLELCNHFKAKRCLR